MKESLLSVMTLPLLNTDDQSVVGCAQNRVTESAETQRVPIRGDRKEGAWEPSLLRGVIPTHSSYLSRGPIYYHDLLLPTRSSQPGYLHPSFS